MTNYEKIKNMSVEEMAIMIYNGASNKFCDLCEYVNGHCNGVNCVYFADVGTISMWLESEVENE